MSQISSLTTSLDGPHHVVATCATTVVPHDENIKEQMLSQEEIGIGQMLTEAQGWKRGAVLQAYCGRQVENKMAF
jgi:hypothetical protein